MMLALRKVVDANLEEWVKDERTLSLDKTFNMTKGVRPVSTSLSRLCVGLGWDCSAVSILTPRKLC